MVLFGIFNIYTHTVVMACYLITAALLIIVILMQPSVGVGFRAKLDSKVRGRSTPIGKLTYILAVSCLLCCIWLNRYNLRENTKLAKQYTVIASDNKTGYANKSANNYTLGVDY